MHPFFDSTQKILILLAGWLVLTVSVCSLLGIIAGTTLVDTLILFAPLYFLFLLFILPNYYVCQGLPLGETKPLYLLASHILTLFVVTGMWYLLGITYAGFLDNVLDDMSWSELFDMALYINIGIVIIQFEVFVLLHYLFFALDKSRRLEQDALQQKLLISQAELQTLGPRCIPTSFSIPSIRFRIFPCHHRRRLIASACCWRSFCVTAWPTAHARIPPSMTSWNTYRTTSESSGNGLVIALTPCSRFRKN